MGDVDDLDLDEVDSEIDSLKRSASLEQMLAPVAPNGAPVPTVVPRRPALHGAADFISWTWEMVNAGYDDIGWSADGSRILVKKPERLASLVLPQFFRHSQYASWVRALNAYNFKKVGVGQWEHPCFHRDKPELLKKVVRKGKEAKAAASYTPAPTTALAHARTDYRNVGEILAEERSRLWWMKQEMQRLEIEVQEAQREEVRQRWEAVALTQYIFEQMKLQPKEGRGAASGEPAITMLSSGEEPAPGTRGDARRGGAHPTQMRLAYTPEASRDASRQGSGRASPAPPSPPLMASQPSLSRISSRDLSQLDLGEIAQLSQGIDLGELERLATLPPSPSPPRAGLPPSPPRGGELEARGLPPQLPNLTLADLYALPQAATPPLVTRDGLSNLSQLSGLSGLGNLSAGSETVDASSAADMQKAAVDFYFNQLSRMVERGVPQIGKAGNGSRATENGGSQSTATAWPS